MSAFTAPLWCRLLPALAVVLAWLASESALATHTPPVAPAAAAPRTEPIVIDIESTAAMTRWSVRADGVEATPTSVEPRRWRGSVNAARLISVAAEPDDPLADAPSALRVHLARRGVGHATVLWGRGSVAGVIDLQATP